MRSAKTTGSDRFGGSGGRKYHSIQRIPACTQADTFGRAAHPWRGSVAQRGRRHLPTGALVVRPEGWEGKIGDLYALDMIIGDELNIHVDATVARITTHHLGFAYARIPPEKEVPLWNLLGGYADKIEPFDD
jgi:hypothetical protein